MESVVYHSLISLAKMCQILFLYWTFDQPKSVGHMSAHKKL
jgi:hypothetical protein